MEKGAALINEVFFRRVSTPALNKWTTVAPCVSLVTAMQHFCQVIPKAFAACFPTVASGRGRAGAEESSSTEPDQGVPLGQPIDQTKLWRKLARRRQRKAAAFVQDTESCFLTLLWSVLTRPIMVIHFSLFKHSKWFTERDQTDEDISAFGRAAIHPARKAMALFRDMAAQDQHEAWLPLIGMYGPVLRWPQAHLRVTRRCFLTIAGQLWRKLVEPWQRYPWKLLEGLVHGPDAEKRECARAFFNERDCCLDNFSNKLRKQCPDVDRLLADDTLAFLKAVFDRVVPTSTYVERCFARFSAWTDTKGHHLSLPQLCAKHSTHTFKGLVDHWRSNCIRDGTLRRPRSNKHRPSWISTAGRKTCAATGLHLFAQEQARSGRVAGQPAAGAAAFQQASRAWRLLTVQEKQVYKRQAKARNVQARLAKDAIAEEEELEGGPWGIGSPTGHPLARQFVVDNLANRRDWIARYKESTGEMQAETENSLEGAPQAEYPMFSQCGAGCCFYGLADAARAELERFHKLLCHVILKQSPTPQHLTAEPLVLAAMSESAGVGFTTYSVVAFNSRKSPIDAAMGELEKDATEELPQGVCLRLRLAKTSEGGISIHSDRSFCYKLFQRTSDWTLHRLQIGPVRDLSTFDVLSVEPIDADEALRSMKAQTEAERALKALRSIGKKPPAKKPARQGGRKTERKANLDARRERRLLRGQALTSDESQSQISDQSQADCESESDNAAAEVSEASPPAEAPPPAPAAAPAPAASSSAAPGRAAASRARQNIRRGTVWGTMPAFQIAPIYAAGVHSGWGAICNRHHDAGRGKASQCKKAMSKGSLSDEVCQLRLKRWLVAGLQDGGWPQDKREYHVSTGGVQLAHFESGLSDAELDAAVSHLP